MVELKSALLFGVTMQFKMKMGPNCPAVAHKLLVLVQEVLTWLNCS